MKKPWNGQKKMDICKKEFKIEKEVFGVTYERFSLGILLHKLVKKYNIKRVLEIPAWGVKARPSIYSLSLVKSDCEIFLFNAHSEAKEIWQKFQSKNTVKFLQGNIYHTNLESNSFDLVWNFSALPLVESPQLLLEEMKRLSGKFILSVFVNAYNPGFTIHRLVHKINKIPWTHGNINFNFPSQVKKFLKQKVLRIEKIGLVDCPPWPDSLGLRDLRLHRKKIDLDKLTWESPYINYLANNRFPGWLKLVYIFEKLPLPNFIKIFYAHLFFALGRKL